MYSLWLLPATLVAVPLFFVWRIRRSQRREFGTRLQSAIQPPVPLKIVRASVAVQTRRMKCISPREFLTLFRTQRNLIVVDLRVDAQRAPFPVPAAFVLTVPHDELEKALKWFPTDRSIVFYGTTYLNISFIETTLSMESSAPTYVLQGDLSRLEVA